MVTLLVLLTPLEAILNLALLAFAVYGWVVKGLPEIDDEPEPPGPAE